MNHLYNWNITGHGRVLSDLEQDLVRNNVSHAYLFEGTEAVGKFTVAKTMAKILQCENNYCGECAACREIEKGCHSDTIEKEDTGESIKIEEIKEILTSLNMSKNSPRRIFLAQNIERMTPESANAMLKTLEDPPENVVFLLTASRLTEILPTIISRVRVCHFQRLSENQVKEFVRKLDPLIEDKTLEEIGALAMGRPGLAVKFMKDTSFFENVKKMYNEVNLMVNNPDMVNGLRYIAEVVKDAKEEEDSAIIRDFLDIFTAVLRQHLLENGVADPESRSRTVALVKEAQKARDLLKRNVNKRLVLENLMLNLC